MLPGKEFARHAACTTEKPLLFGNRMQGAMVSPLTLKFVARLKSMLCGSGPEFAMRKALMAAESMQVINVFTSKSKSVNLGGKRAKSYPSVPPGSTSVWKPFDISTRILGLISEVPCSRKL
jgi:hypothetical protein